MYSDQEIMRICAPFTMTTPIRQVQAIRAIQHIVENGIPGDIIEVGVWKGGAS